MVWFLSLKPSRVPCHWWDSAVYFRGCKLHYWGIFLSLVICNVTWEWSFNNMAMVVTFACRRWKLKEYRWIMLHILSRLMEAQQRLNVSLIVAFHIIHDLLILSYWSLGLFLDVLQWLLILLAYTVPSRCSIAESECSFNILSLCRKVYYILACSNSQFSVNHSWIARIFVFCFVFPTLKKRLKRGLLDDDIDKK